MTSSAKIKGTAQAWEDGTLGASAEHAVAASAEVEAALDAALGIEVVELRLPKQLVDDFRRVADRRCAGYKILMREVLQQWASNQKPR